MLIVTAAHTWVLASWQYYAEDHSEKVIASKEDSFAKTSADAFNSLERSPRAFNLAVAMTPLLSRS